MIPEYHLKKKTCTTRKATQPMIFLLFIVSLFFIKVLKVLCVIYSYSTLAVPPLTVVGWSGGAKVLCILHHRGVQLILAYSWARPAILVVGKGRGGMFLFLLFLHFHSCSSFFPVPLFHLLYSLFYLFFSLSLGDNTKWPSRVDVSLNPNTIKNPLTLHRQDLKKVKQH